MTTAKVILSAILFKNNHCIQSTLFPTSLFFPDNMSTPSIVLEHTELDSMSLRLCTFLNKTTNVDFRHNLQRLRQGE